MPVVVDEALTTERKPKRRLAFARKIDRKKVQAMRRQGLPVTDIAKHQGVNVSTIWRFLERSDEEQRALDRFKLTRADEFTKLQGKAIGVSHRIIELMAGDVRDGVVNALTPSAKAQWLNVLNNVQGTIYDKERLERGESTSNVSIISRMVDTAVDSMYKPKPLKELSSGKPDQ